MESLWIELKRTLVHMFRFQKRKRIQRYGLSVLLVFIVFFVHEYYFNFLGDHSAFLLATFVITVSSWLGGFGPGILSTILFSIGIYFLYFSNDISISKFENLVIMLIFIIEGLIISTVSEARFEMERQKDEFIAFITHEIKNPLSTILGYAQLAVNKANSKNDSKLANYGEQIVSQSNRILNLINDLLDIVKIEVGSFTYTDKEFDLKEIIYEIISHQRILNPNRKILLFGKRKIKIYGDEFRIKQLIINLISNAIKYSPENESIIVKFKSNKYFATISIRDHGIGINKNDQNKIFQMYYRLNNNNRDGIGIGLYICCQIIKHHLGKIWVESKLGKGSTFYVQIPTDFKNNIIS